MQRLREETPARTHLFLRVDLEGEPWLVDVGVGGLTLTSAIRFVTDREQSTPHERRRITRESGRYFHQALLGPTWSDVCEFTGEEMPPIDREVANWFTSTHPNSHFRNRLMVARAVPNGGRYSLLNDQFTVRDAEGRSQHRAIQSAQELLAILEEYFGLMFPPSTRFGPPGSPWPN